MWYSAIAFTLCVVIGMIVSFLTKAQDPSEVNPDLISPGFKGLFKYWPKFVREYVNDIDIGSRYVSYLDFDTKVTISISFFMKKFIFEFVTCPKAASIGFYVLFS